MINIVTGILIGMGLAVVIQIVIPYLKGKSFKLKKKKEDVIIEEPKLTAEEKFDKICKKFDEDKEMAFVDSVIDFCQGK